jgi:hypothetical protein
MLGHVIGGGRTPPTAKLFSVLILSEGEMLSMRGDLEQGAVCRGINTTASIFSVKSEDCVLAKQPRCAA